MCDAQIVFFTVINSPFLLTQREFLLLLTILTTASFDIVDSVDI